MSKRILCFGDSNTWGYIPGTGKRYSEEIRWPMVLQNILKDEFTIIEDGINGRTTCFDKGWGECKNGKTGLGYALLANYPLDGVVLMLGTNDLAEKNAIYAAQGCDELIRIIQNANNYFRVDSPIFENQPKILLVIPPALHPSIDNSPVISFHGKYKESLKFKEYYQDVAKKRNVGILNASDYAKASEIDYLHLDSNSHKQLANAIATKLKEMF